MQIIVDAFGGDNAPLAVVEGCAMAVKEYGCGILLVGDTATIGSCAEKNGISLEGIQIRQASAGFAMSASPRSITKENKDTSLAVGLRALADGEGDAFVTAGSTGALVLGAMHFVGRGQGVSRAAIASILPTASSPVLLMDSGANSECRAEHLLEFAHMGSAYMQKVMGVEVPKVGLANIGTEPNKGDRLRVEAYSLLESSGLNFAGNAEIRDIPRGGFDVVVADGFTGNVILKMYEGTASMLLGEIKSIFLSGTLSKLSYLGVKNGFDKFRKKMDYTEYGGAPLLGFAKPVIKAHGASDKKAFKNAVGQAAAAAGQ